jgi:NADPH-dependent 2,4-dienoyl-CoA reductase/sulfur reductase-like enzyme
VFPASPEHLHVFIFIPPFIPDLLQFNHRADTPIMAAQSKIIENKGQVAIIGSGPAGLFAAWALVNDGYDVSILEKVCSCLHLVYLSGT